MLDLRQRCIKSGKRQSQIGTYQQYLSLSVTRQHCPPGVHRLPEKQTCPESATHSQNAVPCLPSRVPAGGGKSLLCESRCFLFRLHRIHLCIFWPKILPRMRHHKWTCCLGSSQIMKKQEQFIYIWYLLVQCHHLTRKPAFIPKCHGEWRLRVNPQFTSQISGFCHIGNLISWNLALPTSGGFCFPLWPALLISAAGRLGRQILLSLITKTGGTQARIARKPPPSSYPEQGAGHVNEM